MDNAAAARKSREVLSLIAFDLDDWELLRALGEIEKQPIEPTDNTHPRGAPPLLGVLPTGTGKTICFAENTRFTQS